VSALSKLRILELSNDVAGEYCGKLLADFGAEIIKIEQPGQGSDSRRKGPFASGVSAENINEASGLFAYLNTNKRSVTLDLSTPQGKQTFLRLLSTVDVIIDDHPKGYLQSLGLDPANYTSSYPQLVVCAITPFGYEAPANLQKAYSLNVFQSSGWGYHSPSHYDPGTPPLKGAGRFLVDYEAGLSAAVAVMATLYWRENSAAGQFVDVSQQESLASLSDYVLSQMVAGQMDVSTKRSAFDLGGPATFFQCRDGYVYLFISEPGHWNGLYTLMGEPQWMNAFPDRWLELHLTPERIQECRTQIGAWMKDQDKHDVAARAQKLGIPLAPVNTVKDIFESPQLQFRKFFTAVEHPVLKRTQYPTVPYQLSATPAQLNTAAPLLGEHTDTILRTLSAAQSPVQSVNHSEGAKQKGPLHGVRVVELTKIWAGPYVGKLLTFLGAEVIRVESLDSLDVTRRYGVKDINAAPGFQSVNPGKLSIQLNTKTEAGQRLLKDLIKKSDIVIENLRPGAVKRMGFGYEQLRAIKPDIIAVSMSMYGQDGPLSYQSGYAPLFSALGGLCHLVGVEQGAPKLLNVRYGDSTYGTTAAFAALIALFHRRRTGEGQYVDVSAVESIATMLGDAFMDYFLTGHIAKRDGNHHPQMAPHGCYPCGEEDWISIAVHTDAEWHALCAAMSNPALTSDARFVDSGSRVQHADELDQLLVAWTKDQDARVLSELLQSRGVAAFKSLNSVDMVSDEHLWQRGFYQQVADRAQGSMSIVGAPWRMSVTSTSVEKSAPHLGEHNDYVFGEVLGLSVAARARLIADKIVY
jgi:crotonobetainyl-CoA:carnitine CoA-transferase CaiB-like acyl-CoA transferase